MDPNRREKLTELYLSDPKALPGVVDWTNLPTMWKLI
jgi:hypothetical protein